MVALPEIIREKQQRLVQLEAEATALRAELLAAKRALEGVAADLPPPAPHKSRSSTDLAAEVLQRAQKPMHVTEIIASIRKDYEVTVQYATLVGNLARLVKKHKTFNRVGPNEYGLVEWEDQKTADELFGRQEQERYDPPDYRRVG